MQGKQKPFFKIKYLRHGRQSWLMFYREHIFYLSYLGHMRSQKRMTEDFYIFSSLAQEGSIRRVLKCNEYKIYRFMESL